MKYTMNAVLPQNGLDSNGNITPFAVLNLFQDAANIHGEILGVSFEKMLEKNLLWVVTRIRFEVCGNISEGQELLVTTWPLAPSRVGYERDYLITDNNGNILIRGSSNWAVIDADTRHLSPSENFYNTDELCSERAFDTRSKRIRNFDADKKVCEVVPDQSMIDCNNHVNNTHYASFAQMALGEYDRKISAFQIDYHREVLCGQSLSLYTAQDGEVSLVKGENSDGELMFCASAQFCQ